MNPVLADIVPRPPAWSIDWASVEALFAWFRHLHDCPQDPVHHAEGDVQTHTKMVCEALVAQSDWQSMAPDGRQLLFWAALLHDVAKPRCTRTDPDGRIRAPGHFRKGQIMARRILWELGFTYDRRETLCHLITHHQLPLYAIERDDAARQVHFISHQTRCDFLAMLAQADATGRICADQARLLDNIELFKELCRQEQCFDRPRAFASDHSRVCYFRTPGRSPDYEAFDDTRSEVTLLSGLPASGKDNYIAGMKGDIRVVSLDDIRAEQQIEQGGNQGRVVASAK